MVPLLEPLTKNQYTIDNGYNFRNNILNQDDETFMVSFDIESLFTNVPVNETIDIIIRKLFPESDSTFHNFNSDDFRTILKLAVLDTPFIFNNVSYEQIEGVAMGSPLGPTFANIFIASLEEAILNSTPSHFKPVFFKRYVDDTFALFKHESEAELFLDFINSLHPNIKYTLEKETNGKLAFLDLLVSRGSDGFNTEVYRKQTFTGLGLNFYSFCDGKFKKNCISTLLYRAFHYANTWPDFHKELEFLKRFFINNCFPEFFTNRIIKNFLNQQFIRKTPTISAQKLKLYASIPFIFNSELKKGLNKLLAIHFPAVKVILVEKNPLTISSLFNYKDKLSDLMTAGVVYKYVCPRCTRGVYIGSSIRSLHTRISNHRGVSHRTGCKLTKPEFSSIRNHSLICKTNIQSEDFQIIGKAAIENELLTLESLLIKKTVPQLNSQTTSTPLFLV